MLKKLVELSGFAKLVRIYQMIQYNGGVLSSIYKIHRFDTLKMGRYVGSDCHGNKYFESDYYFIGRNRWVEYSPSVGLDYDGSQIPPEWHGWMHNRTNDTPITKPPVEHKWKMAWKENMSGSKEGYYPYSTTKAKIEAWTPPRRS